MCSTSIQSSNSDEKIQHATDVPILPTAVIYLKKNSNIYGPLRALCDSAAQLNLIRADVITNLNLSTIPCTFKIRGVNDEQPKYLTDRIVMELLSKSKETVDLSLSLVAVPYITELLPNFEFSKMKLPDHINSDLADDQFNKPNQIDVLLNSYTYAKMMKSETIEISSDIIAHYTKLGWLILGQSSSNHLMKTIAVFNAESLHQHDSNDLKKEENLWHTRLDELLRKFWEVEQINQRMLTEEQRECEENFVKTHYRDSDGHYVVEMLLNEKIHELGSSRAVALRRFYALEKRLLNNPELQAKYVEFMRTYESSGHMEKCTQLATGKVSYIPHHYVGPKFRVVFDGSCKSDTGVTLNDVQPVGARLQSNLVDIIFRFRCYKYAMAADIIKMFRQIKITPEQYDLQRIFWRENPSQPIKEYWLTCVTQGTASAPFNAVRAMLQCGRDHKQNYPLAHQAIENQFYMDDGLFGQHTSTDALKLRQQLIDCLNSGGFRLDKWQYCSELVTHMMNNDSTEMNERQLNLEHDSSVLGVKWSSKADLFSIKVISPEVAQTNLTKTDILSTIARLYDPCGYLAPTIIIGRIIMQDTWRLNVAWNETPPEEIMSKWKVYYEQLPLLSNFQIPRWLGCSNITINELHGFSDASKQAYGAVIYMRSIQMDGIINISLIMARSRVAPIKTISIPRLELCAAELLAQLAVNANKECCVLITNTFLWTDSMIVLHWLQKLPTNLDTFVANRVSNIQSLTKAMHWRHVPTKSNPADLISRGILPKEFIENRLWINGPEWLKESEDMWPAMSLHTTEDQHKQITSEYKKREQARMANIWHKHNGEMVVNVLQVDEDEIYHINNDAALINILMVNGESILKRRSTLRSVLRVTAHVFRFVNAMLKRSFQTGCVKAQEQEVMLTILIRFEQGVFYKNELYALRAQRELPLNSKLIQLTPWLDPKDGIIKVGGRVQNSTMTFEEKHPIILPAEGKLSRLLINDTHSITKHGNVQLLMNTLRQKYWIPRLRQLVKGCVSHCVTCTRVKGKSMEQLMGNLPSERLQLSRCFKEVGVDFAGPIVVRAKYDRRCAKLTKGYICIFVCMASRAVHLEAVEDLTAAAFIDAFKRMVARRGPVKRCWSDNAGNFTRASKELKEISEVCHLEATQEEIAKLLVDWKFITPTAAHQGGLWESAVRIMKHSLIREMKQQVLTFPGLMTLACQIEACMNSRPVARISDDPTDMNAITPGHFLIGEPLVQPFHKRVDNVPDNRLTDHTRIQKMTQKFWNQFTKDVFHDMQQRQKWNQTQQSIQLNDLVLIKNESFPPTLWQMGRVVELHPGNDSLIRNVTVQTATTRLRRPIQKLCLLPTNNQY